MPPIPLHTRDVGDSGDVVVVESVMKSKNGSREKRKLQAVRRDGHGFPGAASKLLIVPQGIGNRKSSAKRVDQFEFHGLARVLNFPCSHLLEGFFILRYDSGPLRVFQFWSDPIVVYEHGDKVL